MSKVNIKFESVGKSYGPLRVVDGLDLDIREGEFVSLLGPSGSGKSTILMMLAGFEDVSEGTISVGGSRIDLLPPHKRNMGVVFQNYALFPHMTVAGNIAFPLEMQGVSRADIAARVSRTLDMVQLSSLKDRRPIQLSGGQQQRVALARALVFEPSVVLMDEPLGALDKQLREQMQLDIRALHKRLGLTIVFVTHDQSEALTMSDRIAVFNRGKIEQIGTPREIYDHPSSRFVAEFIGETNILAGDVVEIGERDAVVALPGGTKIQVARPKSLARVGKVLVSLRPERVSLSPGAAGENVISAPIKDVVYFGDHLRVQFGDEAFGLVAKAERRTVEFNAGDTASLSFNAVDCWVIPS
ncbi:ABC transporter ATP-binding protein [Rhizobium metallidurans]|uniref:Spermidine/putrescine import ATP-binding protein PotA n=1 Tax=Rhizobium metallidurans TaxID=1265931 RepID=A0A7W6D305_9HYPH|nr:ABC transporter ATP-binding protein [Rhizobium metallidurans]MBB3967296.1 putative spermidine/putrescine transport system ATP-binding protein [Rhizobium metallidurans]